MIPHHYSYSPSASPRQEIGELLPCLGLPQSVQAAAMGAFQNPRERPPPLGEISPEGRWRLEPGAAEGLALFQRLPDGNSRRWVFADGGGRLQGLLQWNSSGEKLLSFILRLPSGQWMEVRPGAAEHALWGRSDLVMLREGGEARELAVFQAVDYGHISHIPPLDKPGNLPPGGGEALLNLLAMLLRDQGTQEVRYRGPYPTEQLFQSLQRSFTCIYPEGAAALAAFTREEFTLAISGAGVEEFVESPVVWRPAPFAPVTAGKHLLAAVRDGVEAVWLDGSPFRRHWAAGGTEVQGAGSGPMAGGARVWEEAGTPGRVFRVGLVLLGAPYRIVCTLDEMGASLEQKEQEEQEEPQGAPRMDQIPRPASDLWNAAVFAWAACNCTPALAPSILALAPHTEISWAPLPHALAAMQHNTLLLQSGAHHQFQRLRGGEQDSALALMLVSDLLSSSTPILRRRAQAALAASAPSDIAGMAGLAELRIRGESACREARETLNTVLPALIHALLEGAPAGDGLMGD